MTRFSTSLKLMAAAALIALAGCTTKPPANTAPPPVEAPPSPSDIAPVTSQSSNIIPGRPEDLRVNVGDTVHFGYDRYELRDEVQNILQRAGRWLQKNAQGRATPEGHCDERGTREYNLALGARRANAVKEYLVSQGVSTGRVETVSYGKERPMCTESSEACWAQNRRGVTVLTGGVNS